MDKRQRAITGAVGLAAMAGLGLLGANVAQAGGNGGGSADDPALNGSVAAPAEQEGGAETDASEAAESASLEALATLSPADAKAAALAAVPGTAARPELENENGSVVYGVEVTQADGTVVDVKVDAGNGDILAQDDESGEAGHDEGPETGPETGDGPESADG